MIKKECKNCIATIVYVKIKNSKQYNIGKENTRSEGMSAAEIKEIISFVGIALLIVAIALITLSRRKLTGVFSIIVSIVAYLCFIIGGFIVVFVVLSGPTG